MTLECSHGWMQHCTLYVPGLIDPLGPVLTLTPVSDGMSTLVGFGPASHSGATLVMPAVALMPASRPPPKLATTVNVWSWPPLLSMVRVCPELRFAPPPTYTQNPTLPFAASWALNWASVVN